MGGGGLTAIVLYNMIVLHMTDSRWWPECDSVALYDSTRLPGAVTQPLF